MRCSAKRYSVGRAPPQTVTVPGLRRTTTCCAAPGTQWLHPAVEPGDAFVGVLGRARAEHLVAQLRRRTARVIELAIPPRHDLPPRGAQVSLLGIGAESGRDIVRLICKFLGNPYGVFRRHAGTLC